jgi:hypothetical protein
MHELLWASGNHLDSAQHKTKKAKSGALLQRPNLQGRIRESARYNDWEITLRNTGAQLRALKVQVLRCALAVCWSLRAQAVCARNAWL